MLDEILRALPRRYCLPSLGALSQAQRMNPATALVVAIERAREALASNQQPPSAAEQKFINALAELIREALYGPPADPSFKAMVLRHEIPSVREYAALSARADQDRRRVLAFVHSLAHPAKLERTSAGAARDTLTELQASAASDAWSAVSDIARTLARDDFGDEHTEFATQLLDHPGLHRLARLEHLKRDKRIHQYQALWEAQGPRPGSDAAFTDGVRSRKRGDEVEGLAATALVAIAERMNAVRNDGELYRVVTSMRTPSSIPADGHRAKTEWDVVLLRRAEINSSELTWDPCLFIEAKASVDAASTDLPRLIRGLQMLSQAAPQAVYRFQTKEGPVLLRGASLNAFTVDPDGLKRTVLYCCDAPAPETPRLLSAASRMQLLSTEESLQFASALTRSESARPDTLKPVWEAVLKSPQWRAVLHQYLSLRQARELMVHVEDLKAAGADDRY